MNPWATAIVGVLCYLGGWYVADQGHRNAPGKKPDVETVTHYIYSTPAPEPVREEIEPEPVPEPQPEPEKPEEPPVPPCKILRIC